MTATTTASATRKPTNAASLAELILTERQALDDADFLFTMFPDQMRQVDRFISRLQDNFPGVTIPAGFPDYARGLMEIYLTGQFGLKAGDFAQPGPLLKVQKSREAFAAAMSYICEQLGIQAPRSRKR